jgi:hypothetical protein
VTVICGWDRPFTIVPAPCYAIADVKVDGVSVGAVASHTFLDVRANHTIEASFSRTTYTIVASAGAGGVISPSGNVTVNCGWDRPFTIVPGASYVIADVKVDGASVGAVASYTFPNVRASHTIEASFARNTAASQVLSFRADKANGTGPYPIPSADSTWVNLEGTPNNATLKNFAGTASSGWQGDGTPASPHRLVFDGVDDVATIPAGNVTELQASDAQTVEMWFKPTAMIGKNGNLVEWLGASESSAGLSFGVRDSHLQVYLGSTLGWVQVAPVLSDRWSHVAVVKQQGEVRVYLNGRRVHEGVLSDSGNPAGEITLGAATRRGPGVHCDFFKGAIGQVVIWSGAMTGGQVHESFLAGAPRDRAVILEEQLPAMFALEGFVPNPAVRDLNVMFSLPSAEPATLELIDVTGRRLLSSDVGSLGPGRHVVRLGDGATVPAGMYWLRLSQGGQVLKGKAAIVR